MHYKSKVISDLNILAMIAEKNSEVWEYVYEKYAPSMYGIICNLTNDAVLATEIFKETFIELKEKQILSKITYALCPYLLRHTYTFARQQLKIKGIASMKTQNEENSYIHILCSQYVTMHELAEKFNLTEEAIKKKLRGEFNELINNTKEQEAQIYNHKLFNEEFALNFNSNINQFK